jgi:hypothetical protein
MIYKDSVCIPQETHYVSATNTSQLMQFGETIAVYCESPESESSITTDGQSASLSWNKTPVWDLRPDFYYCQTIAGLLMWGALSDERTGLSFTIAPGPCQCWHFRIRLPLDSWPYFTVSDSRLHIFCRLLWLAGLRWRYSTPPPHGIVRLWESYETQIIYKNSVRTSQKTHHISGTETNRLMLFGETISVYCENHTEHK